MGSFIYLVAAGLGASREACVVQTTFTSTVRVSQRCLNLEKLVQIHVLCERQELVVFFHRLMHLANQIFRAMYPDCITMPVYILSKESCRLHRPISWSFIDLLLGSTGGVPVEICCVTSFNSCPKQPSIGVMGYSSWKRAVKLRVRRLLLCKTVRHHTKYLSYPGEFGYGAG